MAKRSRKSSQVLYYQLVHTDLGDKGGGGGGGGKDSQVDTSWTQVTKKSFQCSLALAHTSENDTETNSGQVALGGQTVRSLSQLAREVSN